MASTDSPQKFSIQFSAPQSLKFERDLVSRVERISGGISTQSTQRRKAEQRQQARYGQSIRVLHERTVTKCPHGPESVRATLYAS